RPLRHAARCHHRVRREGGRGRRRGRAAVVARSASDQRLPSRRGATVPDARAGPLGRSRRRGRPLPGAAHPGGGGMSLIRKTAAELGALIASGEVSAVEVAEAHLDRMAEVEPKVRAFLHVDRETTLEQARAVDARLRAGEKLGPLAGVPIAHKDIFTTSDMPTTAASKILEGWRPPYDATV